jgi:hypothetical protein
MERLERTAYNRANERQNTVQPQAVNLAYAEPCPDERSRHGSFYLRRVRSECAPLARKRRLSADFADDADFLNLNRRNRRNLRITFALCASREMEKGERRLSHEIRFDTTQSDRGRRRWLHDFTRERHRTRERVPEGRCPARARPWTRCRAMRGALLRAGSAGLSMRFVSNQHKDIEAEGSGCTTLRENGSGCRAEALLRRCARDSKVRTVFEMCASWKSPEISSKMRTFFQGAHENSASSRGERCGPERGPSGEAESGHGCRTAMVVDLCSQTLRNPRSIPILNARIHRRQFAN